MGSIYVFKQIGKNEVGSIIWQRTTEIFPDSGKTLMFGNQATILPDEKNVVAAFVRAESVRQAWVRLLPISSLGRRYDELSAEEKLYVEKLVATARDKDYGPESH